MSTCQPRCRLQLTSLESYHVPDLMSFLSFHILTKTMVISPSPLSTKQNHLPSSNVRPILFPIHRIFIPGACHCRRHPRLFRGLPCLECLESHNTFSEIKMSAMLQDPNKMMTLTGKYGEMRRGTRTVRATRGDGRAGKISGRVREESRAALISLTDQFSQIAYLRMPLRQSQTAARRVLRLGRA